MTRGDARESVSVPAQDARPALVFVIPAYQPDRALLDVVTALQAQLPRIDADTAILVVDDGSSPSCKPVFAQLDQAASVALVQHAVNLGKGAALKSAINRALLIFGDRLVGVVTADADGQHLVSDIVGVAHRLLGEPNSLVLGSRVFDAATPFRSRFGNTVTRWVFRFFTGRALGDTQSGLRGLPLAVLKRVLRIPTQGYDFELEMLISESQRGTSFIQHPITTVYEPGNPTSHFNPLLDSAKIYYVFIRFSALSLSAAVTDYLVFVIALWATGNILLSMALARLSTAIAYFYLARRQVFRSVGSERTEAVKFSLLVVFSMLASYGLVTLQIAFLGLPAQIAKLTADFAMFFMNFAVQRVLVFRPRQP